MILKLLKIKKSKLAGVAHVQTNHMFRYVQIFRISKVLLTDLWL